MPTNDEDVVNQAKKRFRQCEEWESNFRVRYVDDYKFAFGDSENMYQWPAEMLNDRISDGRPCLTVNKTRTFVLQIVNDQRENKSQVEIRPVGNGASYEAAQILEGCVRHIEYQSNAQNAYSNATHCAVCGGVGYWRIVTDYANEDSFDQEIFIKRVADPLTVYLDPDIQEADGSDARFAFVYEDLARDEFEQKYPDAEATSNAPLGYESQSDWEGKDHVRICEYYRKTDKKDTLHLMRDGTTVRESMLKKFQPELLDIIDEISVNSREIIEDQVEWYFIAGSEIIDQREWLGKYIPIVRVIGEETVIDHQLDRRGLVRFLRDPQRMYNFYTSSAVEYVALQSKAPWMAPAASIEGYEEEWANQHLDNTQVRLWKHKDANNEDIPKPERLTPPQMSPAYLQGMKVAEGEFMFASGIYDAQMGAKSNEVSGKAVQERQRAGATTNYNYIDRFADAIRFTGRILVDLIPKVYDVPRIIKILAQDGAQKTVQLDPNHPQAHSQVQDETSDQYNPQQVTAIFNPNIGIYAVEADIGPAYATKRQEAFDAFSQIIKGNPQLVAVAGDLMFRAADFPMADEIAERLANMVPKQAKGGQPDPQMMQQIQDMQQAMAKQHMLLQQQAQELQQSKQKGEVDALKQQISWYEAETKRMAAVGAIDPMAMRPIVRSLVSEVLGQPANPIIAAHAYESSQMHNPDETPPQQVAQQAHAQAAGTAAGTPPEPQEPTDETG